MGLTQLFNEWIVERGSAKVQEKHIALFKDQLMLADKKISQLKSENEILKTEFEESESDLKKSQEENEILRSKIQEYEQLLEKGNKKPSTTIDFTKVFMR